MCTAGPEQAALSSGARLRARRPVGRLSRLVLLVLLAAAGPGAAQEAQVPQGEAVAEPAADSVVVEEGAVHYPPLHVYLLEIPSGQMGAHPFYLLLDALLVHLEVTCHLFRDKASTRRGEPHLILLLDHKDL